MGISTHNSCVFCFNNTDSGVLPTFRTRRGTLPWEPTRATCVYRARPTQLLIFFGRRQRRMVSQNNCCDALLLVKLIAFSGMMQQRVLPGHWLLWASEQHLRSQRECAWPLRVYMWPKSPIHCTRARSLQTTLELVSPEITCRSSCCNNLCMLGQCSFRTACTQMAASRTAPQCAQVGLDRASIAGRAPLAQLMIIATRRPLQARSDFACFRGDFPCYGLRILAAGSAGRAARQ
jgi:hypothetical protein